jgi:hypothetical protein
MPEQPETYQLLLDLGWRWAAVRDGTAHLVPPHGDAALCFRACERPRRQPVTSGLAQRACRPCIDRAGLQVMEGRLQTTAR